MARTNRNDVVANFVRYHGRRPTSPEDLATVNYLMTKAPKEVEQLLAKDSPITGGLLWAEYNERRPSATSTPVVTTPTTETPTTETPTTQAKTSRQDVIANFTRYHGRRPTIQEEQTIEYLMTKDPREVEQLLANDSPITKGKLWAEYSREKPAEGEDKTEPEKPGDGLTVDQKAQYDQLLSDIEGDENFTFEQKAVLKEIAAGEYTSGQTLNMDQINQIVQDAATSAEADLGPYYEKTAGRALEDLRTAMGDIRNEVARFKQQEETGYKQALAQTKESLRARGLTFSGKSRGLLGGETALAKGQMGVEGALPEQRRYAWEDKLADVQQRARGLGKEGERYLGSAGMEDYGTFASPYDLTRGGIPEYQAGRRQATYLPSQKGKEGYVGIGDLYLEKEKEIAQSQAERIRRSKSYI